ncbi:MAG TPA: hypothetical protein VKS60_24600 [Stellaceae bacterium]|nr:hypothetical protein [Stellaceae bacterium]
MEYTPLPKRDRPGILMLRLSAVWLGTGVLAGVPLIYSWYLQSGGECNTTPNPVKYLKGPPEVPANRPLGNARYIPHPKTGVAKYDCSTAPPPGHFPPPTAGTMTVAPQISPMQSVSATSVGWPGVTGPALLSSLSVAPPSSVSQAGPTSSSAAAASGAAQVNLGMFHPGSLSSQSVGGPPGGLAPAFLAGGDGVIGGVDPSQVGPPVQSPYFSATPVSQAAMYLAAMPGPSAVGEPSPTGINYIDQLMAAQTNSSIGPDGAPLTNITYIDEIMAGAGSALGASPNGTPQGSGASGTSAGQNGPASLSNGSFLSNTAATATQPVTNLGVSTNKNGQVKGAAQTSQ